MSPAYFYRGQGREGELINTEAQALVSLKEDARKRMKNDTVLETVTMGVWTIFALIFIN